LNTGREKIKLHFVDSFRFLTSSLDTLVIEFRRKSIGKTRKYPKDLDILFRHEGNNVIVKGIYPDEYMDSFDRF
jgi:hypothetical protein